MSIQTEMLEIRKDENFLCGLFTEHMPPVVLYLTYAGNGIKYHLWADNILLSTGIYKAAFNQEWDSLETLVDALNYLLTEPGTVDTDFFKNHSKEFLIWLENTSATELREYVKDYLSDEHDEVHYKEAAQYFQKYFTPA